MLNWDIQTTNEIIYHTTVKMIEWIKIHERTAEWMDELMNEQILITEWMNI